MGRIVLSGRATPVEVWEPAPQMDAGLRATLVKLWERFDGGDTSTLPELEQIAHSHTDDAALANVVSRIREACPAGHFVLGSKYRKGRASRRGLLDRNERRCCG